MADAGWKVLCDQCGEGGQLRRCGRCYSTHYCSKFCQAKHWPAHKEQCLKDTPGRPSREETIVTKEACSNKHVHGPERNKNRRKQSKSYEVDSRGIITNLTNTSINEKSRSVKEMMEHEYSRDDICSVRKEGEILGIASETQVKGEDEVEPESDKERAATDKVKLHEEMGDYGSSQENEGEVCNNSPDSRLYLKSVENKHAKEVDDTGNNEEATGVCKVCGEAGNLKKCSRCKSVSYCSRECQTSDWKQHKRTCRTPEKSDKEAVTFTVSNFDSSLHPVGRVGHAFFPQLSPEKARIIATKPPGSFAWAASEATRLFPGWNIIVDFEDIPFEDMFPFMFPFPLLMRPKSVLVAFMYRYHEHVMRHGVYLKDASDATTHVEFYLDHLMDIPFPFFSYSQVRPGGYICIKYPEVHFYRDGAVGLRINDPSEVHILDMSKFHRR